jgi:hypothetical protein
MSCRWLATLAYITCYIMLSVSVGKQTLYKSALGKVCTVWVGLLHTEYCQQAAGVFATLSCNFSLLFAHVVHVDESWVWADSKACH